MRVSGPEDKSETTISITSFSKPVSGKVINLSVAGVPLHLVVAFGG